MAGKKELSKSLNKLQLPILVLLSFVATVLAGARSSAQALTAANDLTTRYVKSEESNLGDIVADAIRDAAKTDVAFIAASSFEEITIKKGPTSAGDILKSL